MPHLHDHRPLGTALVLIAGLWTLLASSTFEEGDPDTQARVSFTVSTSTTAFTLEDGTVESSATNLRVAGDYETDLGDPLTIQRNNLTVDVSTGFDVSVSALDVEDDLAGEIDFGTAFEALLDIDEDPTQGQFSVIIDGTTTLLTVENDGFTIETGSEGSVSRSFDAFRDAIADEDEDEPDDVRLSSAAYAYVPLALQLARIAEAFGDDIELNAETLEGMNLNESLTLTSCGNTDGERVIIWTEDASGTGEGEVGAGDSFELRVESCLDNQLGRFLDGVITLEDYIPIDEDAVERSFGGTVDFALVFVSEQEVNVGTNPSATSPRVDGTLVVRYDELEIEVVTDDDE